MKFQYLKYGAAYFGLVFAAGFALGTMRVLVLEPKIGPRYAELIEIPVMLFLIYRFAKFVVAKMMPTDSGLPYIFTGVTALALLLLFEFTLVLGLQGMSIVEYLDSRDTLAFSAYIFSLILFALMPWLVKSTKGHAQ